jgi:hypothetical protein
MKTKTDTSKLSAVLWSLLVLTALVFSLAGQPVQAAPQVTIVGGIMASDTTWTEGETYQIDSYIDVPDGVTLTIESGVTIENYDDGSSHNYNFTVEGALIANGTAAQPIQFKPGTNGWSGITITGQPEAINTGSVLNYVIAEGGGYGASGVGANLIVQYAVVDVYNSQFDNSPGDGILGNDAGAQGVANIYDTSFTGNQGYAVNFEDGSVNPVLANLTATGNGASLTVDGDVVNIVNDTLDGAHVWENMGLPYLIKGTIVGFDSELIVEPGVQVLAYDGNDVLDVQGSLIASGTPAQPIRFDPVDPASGWSGIAILGEDDTQCSTGNLLDHVVITKGGFYGGCNLYVNYGDVAVANSQLEGDQQSGVCLEHGANLVMTNTLLTNNQVYAMDVLDAAAQFTLDNLAATGNTSDTIGIDIGTMMGDHTWPKSGINTYDVYGYVTVATTGTLTIEPGVTVLFGESDDIAVWGVLTATGTISEPILFTGETPITGTWAGLNFWGTPEQHAVGLFTYATIEYGGYGNGALVSIEDADVTFDHCILRYSSGDAIRVYPGPTPGWQPESLAIPTVSAAWGQFTDIDGYAIDNQASDVVVQAAYNWWNSPTGPTTANNPGGTGETINGNLIYRPYLVSINPFWVYRPLIVR